MENKDKIPTERIELLDDKLNGIFDNLNTITNQLVEIGNSITELSNRRYITETWNEGASWYRVWSDGFIEQGGSFASSTTINATTTKITFVKPFTSLVMVAGGFTKSSNNATYGQNMFQTGSITLTNMVCSIPAYNSNGQVNHSISGGTAYWYAYGY